MRDARGEFYLCNEEHSNGECECMEVDCPYHTGISVKVTNPGKFTPPTEEEIEEMVQELTKEITYGHDRVYAVNGEGKILGDTTYEEIADKLRWMAEWVICKMAREQFYEDEASDD